MTLRDVGVLLRSLACQSGMLLCDTQGCWCVVAEFSMSVRNVAV